MLNSYSGVTVALKRAIELQPVAQDRSVKVAIDDDRALQAKGHS